MGPIGTDDRSAEVPRINQPSSEGLSVIVCGQGHLQPTEVRVPDGVGRVSARPHFLPDEVLRHRDQDYLSLPGIVLPKA